MWHSGKGNHGDSKKISGARCWVEEGWIGKAQRILWGQGKYSVWYHKDDRSITPRANCHVNYGHCMGEYDVDVGSTFVTNVPSCGDANNGGSCECLGAGKGEIPVPSLFYCESQTILSKS